MILPFQLLQRLRVVTVTTQSLEDRLRRALPQVYVRRVGGEPLVELVVGSSLDERRQIIRHVFPESALGLLSEEELAAMLTPVITSAIRELTSRPVSEPAAPARSAPGP